MGFNVSVIAEILKFPYPLFPKYKHTYPLGLRYAIPDTNGVETNYEFIVDLPLNNTYELQSIAFSSTGYKDGDNYSLIKNSEYILRQIFTKELGQVKEIRPIVKIIPGTDVLKFVFNNKTGTSKVVWLDLDLTSRLPVTV